MRGHNNVQGAADMGSMPDELPGYQAVDDPEVRARFEKGWNVPSTAEGAEDRTGGIILRGCLVVACNRSMTRRIASIAPSAAPTRCAGAFQRANTPACFLRALASLQLTLGLTDESTVNRQRDPCDESGTG
jgi:anaerobic selenocysteine-containing dehydrogenase